MAKFKTKVEIPEDDSEEIQILDYLKLELVKEGVMLSAKSELLCDFMKAHSKGTFRDGDNWGYKLGGEHYKFAENFQLAYSGTPNLFVVDANTGRERANLVWISTTGLGKGVKILFNHPVQLPADLIEYCQSACAQLQELYMRSIKKYSVEASLSEHVTHKPSRD